MKMYHYYFESEESQWFWIRVQILCSITMFLFGIYAATQGKGRYH